jgi:micrococcal nuclease
MKRLLSSLGAPVLIVLLIVGLAIQRPGQIRVRRVIDGDTIQLTDGRRLRYIGIDTPELGHRNPEIRDMAKIAKVQNRILVAGKDLTLEYDVEKRDHYDRLLAYVFLKDRTFVNAELVKQGYALIMSIPPNVKYAELFLRLQQEAREAKRGFWADEYSDFENIRKGYK